MYACNFCNFKLNVSSCDLMLNHLFAVHKQEYEKAKSQGILPSMNPCARTFEEHGSKSKVVDLQLNFKDRSTDTKNIVFYSSTQESVQKYKEVRVLVCKYCDSKFKEVDPFLTHVKKEHYGKYSDQIYQKKNSFVMESKKFKCTVCNSTFITLEKMMDHIEISHKECSDKETQNGFNDLELLDLVPNSLEKNPEHTNLKQGNLEPGKSYECVKCLKRFPLLKMMDDHLKTSHQWNDRHESKLQKIQYFKKSEFFECKFCKLRFTSMELALSHIKNQHKKECREKINLKRINQEMTRKMFECKFCVQKFPSLILMLSHLKDVHNKIRL